MQDRAMPLNPVPWIVWVLVAPMIGLEVIASLGEAELVGGPASIGWRSELVQRLAFSPDILRAMIEARTYPLDGLLRLVSYPFVHVTPTHALMVVVVLLALGKFVGEAFRWWAVLVLFFGGALIGAASYTAFGLKMPLAGAWVPVYALIGAFTQILWMRLKQEPQRRWRAFSMIGMLLLCQIVFGALFGFGTEWVAELPAFALGFALSFVVAPGGAIALRDQIRHR